MDVTDEQLMDAIRAFNAEMGRQAQESWDRVCAILEDDERQYLSSHPETDR